MRMYSFLFLLVFPVSAFAQDWCAVLSLSQGMNYALIRKSGQQSLAGHSMGFDFCARYHRARSGIFFEPGLWLGKNTLRAKAADDLKVNIHQQSVGLAVKAGLYISKSSYIRVGVLTEMVGYAMVETVSGGMKLGRSEFQDHLYPRQFMSGMVLGIGGRPGNSRMLELFLEIHQYLTSPFLEPFTLDALGSGSPPVFNSEALSTVVLGGIAIKFVKPQKKAKD